MATFDFKKELRLRELQERILHARNVEDLIRDRNRESLRITETEVILTGEGGKEPAVLFELADYKDIDGIIVTKEHLDQGRVKRFDAYQQLGLLWEERYGRKTG